MEILKEYSLLFPRGVAAGRKPQRSAWLLAVQARPVSEVSHSAQGLQPPLGARWATAVLRRAPQLTDPIEENRGPGTQRRDPGQRRTKRIKPHRRQTGGARKPQRTARLRAARPGPALPRRPQGPSGATRRLPAAPRRTELRAALRLPCGPPLTYRLAGAAPPQAAARQDKGANRRCRTAPPQSAEVRAAGRALTRALRRGAVRRADVRRAAVAAG